MIPKQQHIVSSINAEGEIIDGAYVIYPVRKKNAFKKGWFAMANKAMGEILNLTIEKKLQHRDMQTLFAMLEVLELDNFIRVSQAQLAKRLRMAQPNISKCIKNLVNNSVLLKGPKIGTSSTYRLNPSFGWKGGALQHHEALRERMKNANITKVLTGQPVKEEAPRDPHTIDLLTNQTDAEIGA